MGYLVRRGAGFGRRLYRHHPFNSLGLIMRITNEKTGVVYSTRTMAERGAFISVVTRRQGDAERVTSRERHPTRAKAYRYAVTMAKTAAANHADIN